MVVGSLEAAGQVSAQQTADRLMTAGGYSLNIHFLNCFTCNARLPSHWRSGTLCLLIETGHGLILVDTGLGQYDYIHPSGILRTFRLITITPLDPEEAAARQITRLGHRPEEVRHIVLTHMHFDYCGGLPDFPDATVHVHRREYEAFTGPLRQWTELAYVRRHIAHQPDVALYDTARERWFDFDAIRLPFAPEMWLIPLFGHSRGHCGVAIRTGQGWLFHVGDAAPIDFTEDPPEQLTAFVLGPHVPRLRQFRLSHPEVQMTTGHMWLDFFDRPAAKRPG
jgi:glyoxylase-like metal-dependent hydrolase (beta-lactamase superfamily II)